MRKTSPKRVVARVFKTGRSQAVRLPKEFRFDSDTVLVHREGNSVVLEPPNDWPSNWVESFTGVPDDFERPEQGSLKMNERVLHRLLSEAREGVAVSGITEGELRTSAAKSTSPLKTLALVENFLSPITLLEYTSDDAIAYASVRSRLERAGTPLGRRSG